MCLSLVKWGECQRAVIEMFCNEQPLIEKKGRSFLEKPQSGRQPVQMFLHARVNIRLVHTYDFENGQQRKKCRPNTIFITLHCSKNMTSCLFVFTFPAREKSVLSIQFTKHILTKRGIFFALRRFFLALSLNKVTITADIHTTGSNKQQYLLFLGSLYTISHCL